MAILRSPAIIVGLCVCLDASPNDCYERNPELPKGTRMRILRRNPNRAAYGIRDKVRTRRGEGIIKYVYPPGPNGKNAYSVDFGDRPVGVIFNEDEITLLQESDESLGVK